MQTNANFKIRHLPNGARSTKSEILRNSGNCLNLVQNRDNLIYACFHLCHLQQQHFVEGRTGTQCPDTTAGRASDQKPLFPLSSDINLDKIYSTPSQIHK